MKVSSSELPALMGGVWDFLADEPPVEANVRPLMVARVAMASYSRRTTS